MLTVRGLPTYVETSGAGPSLLYLHGAAEWVGYSRELVRRLDQAHQVIQPERRGHGRTADPPGVLSYEEMTADTIALLEQLGVAGSPIVGFSDGAIIALQIARARPDLAGKVVAIAENAHPALRNKVTKEATQFTLLRWALPPSAFESGVRRAFKLQAKGKAQTQGSVA